MDVGIRDLLLNIYKLNKIKLGNCSICERKTIFYAKNDWLRDNYHCILCGSIPRQRAIIKYIQLYFKNYVDMVIHESSPAGPSSEFLLKNCKYYSSSHYFPDVPGGQMKYGFRCENLQELTYDDELFDLFVTQDVFEHIMNPDLALKEINRVLKPGGAHIFTVPYYPNIKSSPRAIEKNSTIIHLKEPIYHGNPISNNGSLVTYDWGYDFVDKIYEVSKMTTTILYTYEPGKGIEAEFIEVFISRKKL